jgi:hypothetical protein
VALGSWDGGWAWLEGLESKQRSGKLRVGWSTLQGPWGKKVPWFKWAGVQGLELNQNPGEPKAMVSEEGLVGGSGLCWKGWASGEERGFTRRD